MIVICAWCKTPLGEKEPLDNKNTTHTVCEQCRETLFEKEIQGTPQEASEIGQQQSRGSERRLETLEEDEKTIS